MDCGSVCSQVCNKRTILLMGIIMKPMIAAGLFVIFATIFSAAVHAQSLGNMGDELLSGLESADSGRARIAILDFESRDRSLIRVSETIREKLTTYIVRSKKVDVIERKLLKKIIQENSLEVSGLIDEQTGNRLGNLLGVQAIITGTVTTIDGQHIECNARMIRVDSARILAAANFVLTLNDSRDEIVSSSPKSNDYSGEQLIQIALLLDTSNSMDGLINQAKTKLWKIVNKMATAERANKNPNIEIAVYEYGNDALEEKGNYIRQVLPFTRNLDLVSEKLFSLNTNGGEEYAGAVIRHAVRNLSWKKEKGIYRAIFIAGNEPFTQGPVPFQESVASARHRDIYINTIFCGPNQEGVATGWNDGAVAGRGMFMNIDQEQNIAAVRAPQDDEISRLGSEMNDTFVPYGEAGNTASAMQSKADEMAEENEASGAAVQRSLFKSKKQYSSSMTWDVVSQVESGNLKIADINKKKLPPELRSMSNAQLNRYINKKIEERKKIREKIERLNRERETFVKKEEQKRSRSSAKKSLDRAMEQAVEVQASELDYNFN